jgi:hypothetical protein
MFAATMATAIKTYKPSAPKNRNKIPIARKQVNSNINETNSGGIPFINSIIREIGMSYRS